MAGQEGREGQRKEGRWRRGGKEGRGKLETVLPLLCEGK